MRGKQPESEPFESPFALTILPQRGRSKVKGAETGSADTPAVAAQAAPPGQPPTAAPVHAFAGAAAAPITPPIGYPQMPGFGQANVQPGNGHAEPAQGFAPSVVAPGPGMGPAVAPIPGFGPPASPTPFTPPAPQGAAPAAPPQAFAPPQIPPQGFAPFAPPQTFAPGAASPGARTDGPYHPHHLSAGTTAPDTTSDAEANGDGQKPAKQPGSKKRLALLAIPLVLALAAAAYFYVPKILNSSSSSSAPTISFPARVGTFAKVTDAKTVSEVQLAQRHMRAALPALANLQVAFYGKTPDVMLGAELWPSGVAAKTPAEQASLVQQINKKLGTDGAPEKLTRVALPTKPGELWCGFNPKTGTDPASTDCMYVDRYALVLTTIVGPDNAKNVAKAKLLVPLVERQA